MPFCGCSRRLFYKIALNNQCWQSGGTLFWPATARYSGRQWTACISNDFKNFLNAQVWWSCITHNFFQIYIIQQIRLFKHTFLLSNACFMHLILVIISQKRLKVSKINFVGEWLDYADLFVSANFYLASKIHLLSIGTKMTISYLKKKKTPKSGSDETRRLLQIYLLRLKLAVRRLPCLRS